MKRYDWMKVKTEKLYAKQFSDKGFAFGGYNELL